MLLLQWNIRNVICIQSCLPSSFLSGKELSNYCAVIGVPPNTSAHTSRCKSAQWGRVKVSRKEEREDSSEASEAKVLSGINTWKFPLFENLMCILEQSLRNRFLLDLPLTSGGLSLPPYCLDISGPINGQIKPLQSIPYSLWTKASCLWSPLTRLISPIKIFFTFACSISGSLQ